MSFNNRSNSALPVNKNPNQDGELHLLTDMLYLFYIVQRLSVPSSMCHWNSCGSLLSIHLCWHLPFSTRRLPTSTKICKESLYFSDYKIMKSWYAGAALKVPSQPSPTPSGTLRGSAHLPPLESNDQQWAKRVAQLERHLRENKLRQHATVTEELGKPQSSWDEVKSKREAKRLAFDIFWNARSDYSR